LSAPHAEFEEIVLDRPKDFMVEEIRDRNRDRFDSVRKEIERRLRRVCGSFPDDEFERLLDKMTGEQIRGESRPL
jgi:hypothetical protein